MSDDAPRSEMPPPRPDNELPPVREPGMPPQRREPEILPPNPGPEVPPRLPGPPERGPEIQPPKPGPEMPPPSVPKPEIEPPKPGPEMPPPTRRDPEVPPVTPDSPPSKPLRDPEPPKTSLVAASHDLGPIAERPEVAIEVPRGRLAAQTRRDFLLFGLGAVAAAAGAWWLLPPRTKQHLLPSAARDRLDTLAARVGLTSARAEGTLNRALTFDDDVAEALYSKDRRVRTYERSQRTMLRNNYHGRTPGPDILPSWALQLTGLASGRTEYLTQADLARFAPHEQVTRLVCVEGWSAIAWWGGVRFSDLLAAYPPAPGTKWVALRSSVSLDGHGNVEPYYVSIDLPTAQHPQTLLATHQDGQPLSLAHGAPLRLLAPMKLGLKNIKAITDIAYVTDEPADYWNEQGYSKYDGL